MNIQTGDLTVGDVGVTFEATADETLTGKDVDFYFVKPSGATIRKDTTVSGYTASYTTIAGDIDESGKWYVYVYNATDGYWYINESGNVFIVREKPVDMAVSL